MTATPTKRALCTLGAVLYPLPLLALQEPVGSTAPTSASGESAENRAAEPPLKEASSAQAQVTELPSQQSFPSSAEETAPDKISNAPAANGAFFIASTALAVSLGVLLFLFALRRSMLLISKRIDTAESEIRKNTPSVPQEHAAEAIAADLDPHPVTENIKPTSPEHNPPEVLPTGYRKAGDSLREIRKRMPRIFETAAEMARGGTLPFIGWGRKEKVLVLEKNPSSQKWFFIGDIHGDFLALHRLLERSQQEQDFHVCFLGDLIDRGPHGLECFALLLLAAMEHPSRVLWLAGNHDEALSFSSTSQSFSSSVEPAEFVELLNTPPAGLDVTNASAWGRLFIETVAGLPRAALFPDGLLATHGGIPLEDRWDGLKSPADLESAGVLGDFTWTRATMMPHKKGWQFAPARRKTSSNFEFGYKDLDGFCKCVESFFPVKRVVRGHDHVENGWECPETYKTTPLLTLNGFGFHYLSGSYNTYAARLVVGVYRENQLPETENISFFKSEHDDCSPSPEFNTH